MLRLYTQYVNKINKYKPGYSIQVIDAAPQCACGQQFCGTCRTSFNHIKHRGCGTFDKINVFSSYASILLCKNVVY